MPYTCLSGPGVAEAITPYSLQAPTTVADSFARANASGPSALSDTELLAVLLRGSDAPFQAQLAHELVDYHGDLGRIFNDPPEHLAGIVDRDTATYLGVLREFVKRMSLGQVLDREDLCSWAKVNAYLMSTMRGRSVECFRVLYLDNAARLIRETWTEGTVNFAPASVRTIVHGALSLGATSAIISHCHPSASVTPSRQDIEMTRKIKDGLAAVEIKLIDHVLIAGDQAVSFASLQLL